MQTKSMSNQSKELGKAYREFSRMRYKELKQGLKKVRESQIVQMIIREWDGMLITQKNKFAPGSSIDFLSTPAKMDEDFVQINLKNKSNLKTTTHKLKEEDPEARSGSEEQAEDLEVKESQSNERSLLNMEKTKVIAKTAAKSKARDYISFFRFHYKSLKEMHPNWISNQISQIIKLMWKKEKIQSQRMKSIKQKRERGVGGAKKTTGRKMFVTMKKKEGLNWISARSLWRRLPFESRVMWVHRGNPEKLEADLAKKSLLVRIPKENANIHGLSKFMNKKIEQ